MTRRLPLLAVLLVLPASAVGQELDKEKLRKAAYLPFIGVGIAVPVNQIDPDGRRHDPEREISGLTKKLVGSVEDAETLLDLAGAYKEDKRDAEAQQAVAKAKALLEP